MKYNLPIIIAVLVVAFSALGADRVEARYHYGDFTGEFRVGKVSSADCDFVFEPTLFEAKVFITGSAYREVLIHLRSLYGYGFLNGISLKGFQGHGDQFRVSGVQITEDHEVELVGKGNLNYDSLFMELDVEAHLVPEEVTCTAVAEFAGFPY